MTALNRSRQELLERAAGRSDLVMNGPVRQDNHVMGTCMSREDAAVLLISKNAHRAIESALKSDALGDRKFRRATDFGWHPGYKMVVWRDPLDRWKSSVVQSWRSNSSVTFEEFIESHFVIYHDIHCAPQISYVNGPFDEIVPYPRFQQVMENRLNLPPGLFRTVEATSQHELDKVPVDEDLVRWLYRLDFAVWEGLNS